MTATTKTTPRAARLHRGAPPARTRRAWRFATRAVLIAVAALFVRTWVAQSFTIPSQSMEPVLLPGDFLLVDRFVYGPTVAGAERALLSMRAVRRGDIAVFRLPADPRRHLVKRVVGLPGETLELRGATVYIDGAPLDEPYLPDRVRGRAPAVPPASAAADAAATEEMPEAAHTVEPQGRFGPVTIPPRHYFALGDNRRHSQDSRVWGPLPHDHLAGRAMATYWSSVPTETVVLRAPGAAAAVRRRALAAARFFSRTRWNRVLHPAR